MDIQAKMAADLFSRLNNGGLKGSPMDISNDNTELNKAFKKKYTKTKEKSKNDNETKKIIDIDKLPPCKFAKLAERSEVNIRFNEHSIHYKEQDWPIPERTVVYNIKLIKSRGMAKNISEKIYGPGAEENGDAFAGITRYYEVLTYENVNNDAKTLAYVQVLSNDGKPAFRILWANEIVKKYKVDKDLANKRLTNKLRKMIVKRTNSESTNK